MSIIPASFSVSSQFSKILALPLFSGKVAAGFPSPADDYVEKTLGLNKLLVQKPAATFFVRTEGESMIGAGIFPNDILVVDRSVEPVPGKIVICALNGELVVKRLKRQGGKWVLGSENPDELGGQKTTDERVDLMFPPGNPEFNVRSTDSSSVRQVLIKELENTSYVKYIDDEKTLKAIGDAVRGVVDIGQKPRGEFDVRGISEISDVVKVAISIDSSIGQVVENTLGIGNQQLRDKVMPSFALFFGDIFTYQRNQTEIQDRIWTAINKAVKDGFIDGGYGTQNKPIHLAAHSLGGIVAFDAAVLPSNDKKLWLKSFTTFGSQAAFFQILDARQPLGFYSKGFPLTLPPSIAKWNNLWHPMDLLGFTAGTVFRLYNGTKPKDIVVSEPASHLFCDKLWAHSIYWRSEELLNTLREVLDSSSVLT